MQSSQYASKIFSACISIVLSLCLASSILAQEITSENPVPNTSGIDKNNSPNKEKGIGDKGQNDSPNKTNPDTNNNPKTTQPPNNNNSVEKSPAKENNLKLEKKVTTEPVSDIKPASHNPKKTYNQPEGLVEVDQGTNQVQSQIRLVNLTDITGQIPEFQNELIPGYVVEKLNIEAEQPDHTRTESMESSSPGDTNADDQNQTSMLDGISSWFGSLSMSQGVINILILLLIIIVFTVYRMKGGSSRRI